jgi:hypothetical protein
MNALLMTDALARPTIGVLDDDARWRWSHRIMGGVDQP